MDRTAKTRRLVESAILIAIATVLSMLKLAQLPYGGSITAASMLPIIIISYRHGVKTGLLSGFVYGLVQLVLGVNNLSYATTWKGAVAIVLLDYVIAFLVLGLGGIFRREKDNQAVAMTCGALLGAVLRYVCHVISGATVWAGLSIPTGEALAFSFIYNATYMLPETIVLLIAAFYIGSALDFKAEHPVRIARQTANISNLLIIIAGLVFSAALVFDTVSVFSVLQNGETGKWDISGISQVNWQLIAIISAAAVVISALLLVLARIKSNKKTLDNA
jgi:thiamine transporter